MSTMKSKDNNKISVSQINNIAYSKVVPANSESDSSTKVPSNKKSSTCVLLARKQHGNKTPRHSGPQHY